MIARRTAIVAVGAMLLALPAAAHAHVTVQPEQAVAGAYTVERVRVPNERDHAATTKVAVRMPPGFDTVSYESTPGWTVDVESGSGGESGVSQVTWTADRKADGIQPSQFRDFPLSLKMPDQAGTKLTFKALQTYSNGEVVRWIGTPDAKEPAPQVTLTAAADTGPDTAAAAAPTAAAAPAQDDGGGASQGLAIAALVLGAVGVVLCGAALVRRRGA